MLKLWKDGFSVDDGELRAYADPRNKDFLNSIRRGEIPQELRQESPEVIIFYLFINFEPINFLLIRVLIFYVLIYSKVHVCMEDRRMESFVATKEKRQLKAFSGQGHTLGSPTPATVGAPMPEDQSVNEAHARANLRLDTNQPVTK